MNIVLMAGGGGTRLWPLSRSTNPKQFLDLGSGKTLLEHTYDRARQVADSAHIFVATTEEHVGRVRELLPDVADENVFLETERRDNGPAIAAVAKQLQQRGFGAEPTMFMWSDHVFTAEDAFITDAQRMHGLVVGHPDTIFIMGHTPTFAETGLGYIEAGEPVAGEPGVYRVAAFKEKPDQATADTYLAAGNYFWNLAYVTATPDYLLSELAEYEPELMRGIERFVAALEVKDTEGARAAYAALPKIAIDYAVLERTPRLMTVVGDYGWSDVGNWSAVQDVFGQQGDHVPHGHHVHVDSKNNYIYNATDRTVSMLGLENIIVVVTDDAILVAGRDSVGRVKEVVAKLEEEGKADNV